MTGSYWMAPDLSITITEQEAEFAFFTMDHCDWEKLEKGIPDGATDTSGVLLDRHNRNIRLAVLAEAVTLARGAEGGTGLDSMNNPHFEFMVNAMLDAFDKEGTKA